MTEIFTGDYPLTNIAPGSLGYIECGQGGQLYVRSSSHDQFTLNIEGVGTLIGHYGLQVRGVEVRKVEVRNNGVEPLDVVINIGSAEIIDRRASVSETLRVFDPVTGASFSEILAMMQNENDQRSPCHVVGESYSAGLTSTTPIMLIDPSLNTDGAILRSLSFYAGGYTTVHCDTAAPASYDDTSKRQLNSVYDLYGEQVLKQVPLDIDAGDGVWLTSSAAGGLYASTWDYR